jgi:hypothetical protein
LKVSRRESFLIVAVRQLIAGTPFVAAVAVAVTPFPLPFPPVPAS